jgi:uncharacterized repeat protein (TIGR01451 family)
MPLIKKKMSKNETINETVKKIETRKLEVQKIVTKRKVKGNNMKNVTRILLTMSVSALTAHATGTAAGTQIDNTATLNYQVNSISQTAVVCSNGAPAPCTNTASFLVDRSINLTLSEVGTSYTSVTPGATAQVLTYSLANIGNGTQDFSFTAANVTNGQPDGISGTDAFDIAATLNVFVDSNANNVYDAGVDTATSVDNLAQDTSKTVFVVTDIPLTPTNNQTAGVLLEATALTAAGGALTETAGADVAMTEEVVFSDGVGASDSARDAKYNAKDAYIVSTSNLTITKTSNVISDPTNGVGASRRRMPGAVIEYVITVANGAGAASATNVVVDDAIPANTTFQNGTAYTGGFPIEVLGTGDDVDNNNGTGPNPDNADFGATTANKVTARLGTIAASGSAVLKFRVTVN